MSDLNADWHYAGSPRADVVHMVPAGIRSVLDVGCGRGGFGAHLRTLMPVEVDGIELNPVAAAEAEQRLRRVTRVDIERDRTWSPDAKYDLITFLDVLEHLQDPWTMLERVAGWLAPDGLVLATIPNLRHYQVLKEIVLGKTFTYRREGVLDKTHLRFFTEATMRDLFTSSGYAIRRCEGINGHPFPWKYGLLNRLTLGALEDTRFLQFAIVAAPAAKAG